MKKSFRGIRNRPSASFAIIRYNLRLAIRGDCLGNLLRAVQPPAQFLGSVPVDNSDLIFTTVVVRHVFSP